MRLVDADEIKKRERDVVLANGAKHRCFDTTMLFEIPTVDAEPVVRCKDCIHSEEREGFYYCDMLPFQANLIWGGAIQVDDEHFCGYGIRRKNGNNN